MNIQAVTLMTDMHNVSIGENTSKRHLEIDQAFSQMERILLKIRFHNSRRKLIETTIVVCKSKKIMHGE